MLFYSKFEGLNAATGTGVEKVQSSTVTRQAPGVDLIKLFWSIFTYFFVSYTIFELWKHIVSNNEMVYLKQNPE
jgi:hypothetical protein